MLSSVINSIYSGHVKFSYKCFDLGKRHTGYFCWPLFHLASAVSRDFFTVKRLNLTHFVRLILDDFSFMACVQMILKEDGNNFHFSQKHLPTFDLYLETRGRSYKAFYTALQRSALNYIKCHTQHNDTQHCCTNADCRLCWVPKLSLL